MDFPKHFCLNLSDYSQERLKHNIQSTDKSVDLYFNHH